MLVLRKTVWAVLALFLPLSVPAMAQEEQDPISALEKDLKSLKKEIDDLEKQQDVDAKSASRKRPSVDTEGVRFAKMWGLDAVGTFKDGFQLNLLDPYEADAQKQVVHRLQLNGRIHADFRLHSDTKHPTDDTFLMRRLRLKLSGFLYRDVQFSLEPDFARDGGNSIEDAYINFAYYKPFQPRFGHFRTPSGLDNNTSSAFLNFVERTMLTRVSRLDFDLGAMVRGEIKFKDDSEEAGIRYAVAVQNGSPADNTADNTDDKDASFRLNLFPMIDERGSDLQDLMLGASFTYGHKRDFLPNFSTQSGTVYLVPGTTDQRGTVTRIGPELFVGGGPMTFQAEYMYTRIENVNVGRDFDLAVHAMYFDVLYMLTGERHRPNQRVRPDSNFHPDEGGMGAFEIGLRYEHVDVEADLLRVAARNLLPGVRGTDDVDSLTFGCNWYLNPYTKLCANYQRVWFRDDKIGVARVERNEDIFFFRLALDI